MGQPRRMAADASAEAADADPVDDDISEHGSKAPAATRDETWIFRLQRRLCDPRDTKMAAAVAAALLVLETILCVGIIGRVPYTKIDWDAYMSQVEGFLDGERDYSKLEGDTGPLVYPAGFLYVFAALRWITNGGDVLRGQVVFAVLYLINQAMVLCLYIRAKAVPPWALALLCLSKRFHSIFLLRLFNDCFAITLLHAALHSLMSLPSLWPLTMLLFSAAVSVKMNILLYVPPLLVVLVQTLSFWEVVAALVWAAAFQLLLALPFLLTFPTQYFANAFNLGRVFIHFWSVNLKFLPEHVFVSKKLALLLLAAHLVLLLGFAHSRWCRQNGGLFNVTLRCLKTALPPFQRPRARGKPSARQLHAHYVLTMMMTGNFIGIVCARSLHYQFYSWYFQSLLLLSWATPFPTLLRVLLLAGVEACWNVYPSTPASSLGLLTIHVLLLSGIWMNGASHVWDKQQTRKDE